METTNCPICGSERSAPYRVVHDLVLRHEGEFQLVRCEDCSLIYLNPRPTREEIGRYYEGDYDNFRYDPHQQPSPSLVKRTERTRRLLAAFRGYPTDEPRASKLWSLPAYLVFCAKSRNLIYPTFRRGGRLLDVGCGAGKFLAEMRDLGWEVLGTDISPEAVTACCARGLEVLEGELSDARLPGSGFDVVTLRHSLEHIHDPLGTLREVRRVLKPGGEVIIEAPNIAGLGARVFGEYWFALEPPRHLVHFTPRTLASAVQAAGLGLRRLRFKSSGFVIARSLELYARERASGLASMCNGRVFCRSTDVVLRWLRLSDEVMAFCVKDET